MNPANLMNPWLRLPARIDGWSLREQLEEWLRRYKQFGRIEIDLRGLLHL